MVKKFSFYLGIIYFIGISTTHSSLLHHGRLKEKYQGKSTDIARIYEGFDFQPIWLNQEGQWNTRAQNLLKTLQKAPEEGLSTHQYAPLITLMEKPVKPDTIFKADEQATETLLSYIKDLYKGHLRHLGVRSKRLISANSFDGTKILVEHFKEDPKGAFLPSMTLEKEGYQRLKTLLTHYRAVANEKNWPSLPPGKTLKISPPKNGKVSYMQEKRVPFLRKILAAQGYLKDASQKGQGYDEELVKAVENFQKHHVIKVDGVVGPETTRMLNLSHKDKIDRILLAMERWRWMPKKMGKRYIIVNIPGFHLTAFEDEQKIFDMKIIVGRRYRKTPTFSSEIYSIRFNPSWHVPSGIFRKDKLPKILRDPSYVSRKGYAVYDSYTGQRLNPHNVNWGSGGVKLVQPPGSRNALGKIRFTLKTTNSVYLHGTPEQHLFKKDKRTFSSGCIRVENPQKLAAYVFNDDQNWPLEKIQSESSGRRTKNVPLSDPVPVHIVYLTVWVDQEGIAYFSDDIYHRDRVLLEQIKQIHYPGYIAQVDLEELYKKENEEDSDGATLLVENTSSSQTSQEFYRPSSVPSVPSNSTRSTGVQPYGYGHFY